MHRMILSYAANAMFQLRLGKHTNVLYNLAKGMGALQTYNSDSRFPIKHMPIRLIEYSASFFACNDSHKVWIQL